MCYQCKKKFALDDKEYAIHVSMSTDNGCGVHHIFIEHEEVYMETYWVADDSPCKTVFHFILPCGLSYQKDSIKLLRSKDEEINSSAYHVDISGQELTVTIDNIKEEPFFGYNFQGLQAFRYPISVLFNAEMNDATTVTNTASASVSYEYKGMEKTVDLGGLSAYALTYL